MATFTAAQRAIVVAINNYLRGAPNFPVDERVVDQLAKIYQGTPGFPNPCGSRGNSFRDSMRDEPVRAFIKMLLSTSDGPRLNPCSGGSGPDVPVPPVVNPLNPFNCPTVVNLLTAGTYGVLAGTPNITSTGATTIVGNLGIHPAASVIGFPPGVVIGTQNVANAAALQAKSDLTAAYIALAAMPGATVVGADIGGTTLTPGRYSNATSLTVTGDVIFDGQGDPCSTFLFQVGSTFSLQNHARVLLINGARAANVFIQVGSSATLGTNSILNGSILALTDITANTSATINGRLLARNGAVTLAANAVIVPS